ncbi:MAG: APC family permease [Clostridiaceae bacterium]
MESNKPARKISLLSTVALVIGIVIGSGVFFKPAKVFAAAGTPSLGIIAWIAGGLITLAAALTIAELASAIPKTGGMFNYLKILYGEQTAFLLGWVQTLIKYPGTGAALCIIFATQATFFIPMSGIEQKFLAVGLAIFLTIINFLSAQAVGKLNLVFTIAKLIPIFAIIIFGFISGTVNSYSPILTDTSTATGFGAAMLGVLWAYEGWINITNVAEDIENPKRNLPIGLILGLSIVMVAYVGINAAILNVMPLEEVIASKKPASDAAVILFGNGGAALISAGILISIFGAANALTLFGPRVPYAMAKEGMFPFRDFFGKENDAGVPVNALLVQLVIMIFYIISGSFDKLTNLVVFVLWIFFVSAVAGVFVLRSKHKELTSEYKVPLYPIIPIFGILGGVYILISTLMTDTLNAITGLVIALIGIPVYLHIKKKVKYKA